MRPDGDTGGEQIAAHIAPSEGRRWLRSDNVTLQRNKHTPGATKTLPPPSYDLSRAAGPKFLVIQFPIFICGAVSGRRLGSPWSDIARDTHECAQDTGDDTFKSICEREGTNELQKHDDLLGPVDQMGPVRS
jgi:hypothetical protein